MRFLHEALIAAMLLGCDDDSSAPTQPAFAGASTNPIQSTIGEIGGAKAKTADLGVVGPQGSPITAIRVDRLAIQP
jgi:hypothetical protein